MTWETAVAVLLVGTVIGIIHLVGALKRERDESAWMSGIRMFLVVLSFWLMLIGSHTAIEIAISNTAVSDVENALGLFYRTSLYAFIFLTGLFVVYYIYSVFTSLKLDAKSKEDKILKGF